MNPEFRLIRYFLAVAEEGNVTRAAERLHISQSSLSAALKQLEAQLGVELLQRRGRGLILAPAGDLLLDRGHELVEHFEVVLDDVRSRGGTPSGRLRLGLSPAARHAVAPDLLDACAKAAPAVMLYANERPTTGELLRAVSNGRLDLAVTYCGPRSATPGIELLLLRDDPSSVYLAVEHPLAQRETIALADLADETIIVPATVDSAGFTERVLAAFAAEGLSPSTKADPYPDLGLQAAREGLGVTIGPSLPKVLEGWAIIPLQPPVYLPYHLAWHTRSHGAGLDIVLGAARALATASLP